jgi:DNA polymerase III epsilon subunit
MQPNTRYVVVDLETTGGSPHQGHRIVEIGAVVVEHGGLGPTFESLVDPGRLIPRGVMSIHGITDSMVFGAPRFDALLPDFLEFCRGAVLVSHNARFDRGFLDFEARLASGEHLPHAHLDTVRLARMLVPGLATYQLGTLTAHFGIEIPARVRHRALGDAVGTAHLLRNLLEIATRTGASLEKGLVTRGSAAPSI